MRDGTAACACMRKVCAHTVLRIGETVAGVAGQWENSVCTACQEERRDRPRASSGKMPVRGCDKDGTVACIYMRGRGRESDRMTHFSDESSTSSAKCGGELPLIHCCFRTLKCRRIKYAPEKKTKKKKRVEENLFRVNKAVYHIELEFLVISLIFTRIIIF